MTTDYKRQKRAPGVLARGMTAPQYRKWYRATYPDKCRQRSRNDYLKNKSKILAQHAARRALLTPGKKLEYRLRHESTPIYKATRKRYRERTKERSSAYQRAYMARKRATPRGNLDCRMASAIANALRGRKTSRKWTRLLGYTVDELCRHIESRFGPGMNWEKLIAGRIHIDHAVPKSKFRYSSPEDIEFKRCWAMENLQPMWAGRNRSKSNKILAPTQIALGV